MGAEKKPARRLQFLKINDNIVDEIQAFYKKLFVYELSDR